MNEKLELKCKSFQEQLIRNGKLLQKISDQSSQLKEFEEKKKSHKKELEKLLLLIKSEYINARS